jgi:VanZ family protein
MLVIFIASSRPLPQEVDRLPDWIGHGLSWMVLSWLVARALEPAAGVRQAVLALAVAIGYGVVDEVHQSFVPGRVGDPMDVLKDAAGAVIGLLVRRRMAAAPSGEVA